MPSKPKYDYDINVIMALQTETSTKKRMSLRAIAKKMGWSQQGTIDWVTRNYPNSEILRWK